jgi:tetratricopeptide (TPR) repeat protein
VIAALISAISTASALAAGICELGESVYARGALAQGNTIALTGTKLKPLAYSKETTDRLNLDLEIAKAVFKVAPDREDSYIWLGRRYGYLGLNSDAIEVFTCGLDKFPDSYKLRRFRARHLARSRQFELALTDYRDAAALIEGQKDTFEPDGIANSLALTLGTYKTYIHYYLGQTSFAVGDYASIASEMDLAMQYCADFSYDDFNVAATYWRYIAYRKMGQADKANDTLRTVPVGLTLIENGGYYEAVQYFQGRLRKADLAQDAGSIVNFAIAMQHQFDGEESDAKRLLTSLVEDTPLGFWPAEAELTRK